MVVNTPAWLAVTSAPGVTDDRFTRPEMGAFTSVKFRLICAASTAACAAATSDWACSACASLSCATWRLMASIFTSSALRSALTRAVRAAACALLSVARAEASAAR